MVTIQQPHINGNRKPRRESHIPTVGNGIVTGTGFGLVIGALLGAATTNPDLTIMTGAGVGAALGLIVGAAIETWRFR
jgi:uncharacterized membrane protein